MNIRSFVQRCYASFSFWGLVVATLFFAASLTPSLLPRHFAVQGVLSGIALAVGYGVGVFLVWLWDYLELPKPSEKLNRLSKQLTTLGVAVVATTFLWRATIWQNSIRQLMEMEPVATAYPWRVALIACVTAVLLIFAVRGLIKCWLYVDHQINRVVPRRISYVLSTLAVIFIVFLVANHVVAKLALDAADRVFLQIDKYVDEDVEQPASALASGSAASLIEWDSIGLQGKNFITTGPTQEQIGVFAGKESAQPLRVYVGVRTKETPQERAKLALEELIRVGGFERSVLIVATPTGTGWLDPGAVDTVEYLHGGDTAIVSIQYSYLPSWITILVDPRRSRDSAHALFDEIYGYWKTLPKDSRPKLYLHGLSLGSLGSEASADLFTVFEDPIQGAVWSGPPFPSTIWNRITKNRNTDSPSWLPQYRDGSMVRFTARENALEQWGKRWSPMRFVYIQHASAPMIFFSKSLLYRSPAWLVGERGPDVSPYLRWYPIVTFLQTAFDLPMATSIPHGYGHNYAASSYIDAWIAVTEPTGWSDEDVQRLKERFKEK
ncbi:MAG: alpha/beta-hydrolase family protein [Bythopirellula sp.]|nr:alpha/beta-hydrolase family protein [Bythopirellula sp.]